MQINDATGKPVTQVSGKRPQGLPKHRLDELLGNTPPAAPVSPQPNIVGSWNPYDRVLGFANMVETKYPPRPKTEADKIRAMTGFTPRSVPPVVASAAAKTKAEDEDFYDLVYTMSQTARPGSLWFYSGINSQTGEDFWYNPFNPKVPMNFRQAQRMMNLKAPKVISWWLSQPSFQQLSKKDWSRLDPELVSSLMGSLQQSEYLGGQTTALETFSVALTTADYLKPHQAQLFDQNYKTIVGLPELTTPGDQKSEMRAVMTAINLTRQGKLVTDYQDVLEYGYLGSLKTTTDADGNTILTLAPGEMVIKDGKKSKIVSTGLVGDLSPEELKVTEYMLAYDGVRKTISGEEMTPTEEYGFQKVGAELIFQIAAANMGTTSTDLAKVANTYGLAPEELLKQAVYAKWREDAEAQGYNLNEDFYGNTEWSTSNFGAGPVPEPTAWIEHLKTINRDPDPLTTAMDQMVSTAENYYAKHDFKDTLDKQLHGKEGMLAQLALSTNNYKLDPKKSNPELYQDMRYNVNRAMEYLNPAYRTAMIDKSGLANWYDKEVPHGTKQALQWSGRRANDVKDLAITMANEIPAAVSWMGNQLGYVATAALIGLSGSDDFMGVSIDDLNYSYSERSKEPGEIMRGEETLTSILHERYNYPTWLAFSVDITSQLALDPTLWAFRGISIVGKAGRQAERLAWADKYTGVMNFVRQGSNLDTINAAVGNAGRLAMVSNRDFGHSAYSRALWVLNEAKAGRLPAEYAGKLEMLDNTLRVLGNTYDPLKQLKMFERWAVRGLDTASYSLDGNRFVGNFAHSIQRTLNTSWSEKAVDMLSRKNFWGYLNSDVTLSEGLVNTAMKAAFFEKGYVDEAGKLTEAGLKWRDEVSKLPTLLEKRQAIKNVMAVVSSDRYNQILHSTLKGPWRKMALDPYLQQGIFDMTVAWTLGQYNTVSFDDLVKTVDTLLMHSVRGKPIGMAIDGDTLLKKYVDFITNPEIRDLLGRDVVKIADFENEEALFKAMTQPIKTAPRTRANPTGRVADEFINKETGKPFTVYEIVDFARQNANLLGDDLKSARDLLLLAGDQFGWNRGNNFRALSDTMVAMTDWVESGRTMSYLPAIRSKGWQSAWINSLDKLAQNDFTQPLVKGLQYARDYLGSTVPRMVVEFGAPPGEVSEQVDNIMRRWKVFSREERAVHRAEILNILGPQGAGESFNSRTRAMNYMMEIQDEGIIRMAARKGITEQSSIDEILRATYRQSDSWNAAIFGINKGAIERLRKQQFDETAWQNVMHSRDLIHEPVTEADVIRQFAFVDPVMVQQAFDESIGMARSWYAAFERAVGKTPSFPSVKGPETFGLLGHPMNGQIAQRMVADAFKGMVGWFKYMSIMSPRYIMRVPMMDEQMRIAADIGVVNRLLTGKHTSVLMEKLAPGMRRALGEDTTFVRVGQSGLEVLNDAARKSGWENYGDLLEALRRNADGYATIGSIRQIQNTDQQLLEMAREQVFGRTVARGARTKSDLTAEAYYKDPVTGKVDMRQGETSMSVEHTPKGLRMVGYSKAEDAGGVGSILDDYHATGPSGIPSYDRHPVSRLSGLKTRRVDAPSRINPSDPVFTMHHELAHQIEWRIEERISLEAGSTVEPGLRTAKAEARVVKFREEFVRAMARDAVNKKTGASESILATVKDQAGLAAHMPKEGEDSSKLIAWLTTQYAKGDTRTEAFAELWSVYRSDKAIFKKRYPQISKFFEKMEKKYGTEIAGAYSKSTVQDLQNGWVNKVYQAIKRTPPVRTSNVLAIPSMDLADDPQRINAAVSWIFDNYGEQVAKNRLVIWMPREDTSREMYQIFRDRGLQVKWLEGDVPKGYGLSLHFSDDAMWKSKTARAEGKVVFRRGEPVPETTGHIRNPIENDTVVPNFLFGQSSNPVVRYDVPHPREMLDINEANSGVMHDFFNQSHQSIADEMAGFRYGRGRGINLDPRRQEWEELQWSDKSSTRYTSGGKERSYNINERFKYGGQRFSRDNYVYMLGWERHLRYQYGQSGIGRNVLESIMNGLPESVAVERAMKFLRDNPANAAELGARTGRAIRETAEKAVANGYRLAPTGEIARLALTDTGGQNLAATLAKYPFELAGQLPPGETIVSAMPRVLGKEASPIYGGGYSGLINAMGRYLFEAPTNVLNRQPYAKFWFRKAYKGFLDQAAAEGIAPTQEMLRAMQYNAKAFAIERTKDVLFDFQRQSRFMEMTSMFTPFLQPYAEAMIVWTRLLMQNPEFGATAVKVYNGMKSAGWVTTDKNTGEQRLRVPVLSWLLGEGFKAYDKLLGSGGIAAMGGNEFLLPLESINFIFNQTLEIPLGNWRLPLPVPSLSPPFMWAAQKWAEAGGVENLPEAWRLSYMHWAYQYGSSGSFAEMASGMMIPRWVNMISEATFRFNLGDPKASETMINAAANKMQRVMAVNGITASRLVQDNEYAQQVAGRTFANGSEAEQWIADTSVSAARSLLAYKNSFGLFFFASPAIEDDTTQYQAEMVRRVEEYQKDGMDANEAFSKVADEMIDENPNLTALFTSMYFNSMPIAGSSTKRSYADAGQGISAPSTEIAMDVMMQPDFQALAKTQPQIAMALLVEADASGEAKQDSAIRAWQVAQGYSSVKTPEEFARDANTAEVYNLQRTETTQYRQEIEFLQTQGIGDDDPSYKAVVDQHQKMQEFYKNLSPGYKEAQKSIEQLGVDPDNIKDLKEALGNPYFAASKTGQATQEYLNLMGRYETMMRDVGVFNIQSETARKYMLPTGESLHDQFAREIDLLRGESPGFDRLYGIYLEGSLTNISSLGEKTIQGLSEQEKQVAYEFDRDMARQQNIIDIATTEDQKDAAYLEMNRLVGTMYERYGDVPTNPVAIWWDSKGLTDKNNYILNLQARSPMYMNRFEREHILGMSTTPTAENVWLELNRISVMEEETKQNVYVDSNAVAEQFREQRNQIINAAVQADPTFAEQIYNLNTPGYVFFTATKLAQQSEDQAGDSWRALQASTQQLTPIVMQLEINGLGDYDVNSRYTYLTLQNNLKAQIAQLRANDPYFDSQWRYYESLNGGDLLTRIFLPDPFYVTGDRQTWLDIQASRALGS